MFRTNDGLQFGIGLIKVIIHHLMLILAASAHFPLGIDQTAFDDIGGVLTALLKPFAESLKRRWRDKDINIGLPKNAPQRLRRPAYRSSSLNINDQKDIFASLQD